jgi:1-acyl-sn-glycerol-3-phosphate acyltransferase
LRRLAAIGYAFVFYPLLALYTAAAVVLLSLVNGAAAPFRTRQANMRRFRRMIAWYGYGIVRGLARPVCRVSYEAPARDPRVAKIFVSNHVSSSDPFLVSLLPEATVQVVNLWPFRLPVWGIFARWAGYLNIRAMAPEAFQEAAMRLLAEGTSIVAFPEGTRAGGRPMGPFHGAMFRLALAARVPLVPMCIAGNERAPARGSVVLEPSAVRVRCLPELAWESYSGMSPFHLKNHVHALIQREVDSMRASA